MDEGIAMDITLRLKVKGVEIELSHDDAMELRDALNDLIGQPVQPYWAFWERPTYYFGTAVTTPVTRNTVWSNTSILTEDAIRDAVTKGRHTNDG